MAWFRRGRSSDTVIAGGGPEQLRILAVKLRTADPVITKNLRRQFRDLAGPVVASVQRSILTMPSHHGAPHLRADIAKTVGSSVNVTKNTVRLSIVSQGRRMPAGEAKLPSHTDAAKGWGHPVFAHGPRHTWHWVHQQGKPGWFEKPIRDAEPDVRRACQSVLDELEHYLS